MVAERVSWESAGVALARLAFWQEIERAAAVPEDFHRTQTRKLSRR